MKSKSITRCMMLALLMMLLAVPAAYAGYGGSATPDFPPSVAVGDTGVNVGLTLVPASSGTDASAVTLQNIILIPQCGARTGTGTCAVPDLGIFSVSATGTGAAGTACAGTNFTISLEDATTGAIRFTPPAPLVLLPTNLEIPQVGQICRINFTVNVLQGPTTDSDGTTSGVQTAQEARFDMIIGTTNVGAGQGSDATTVIFCGDGIVDTALGETCDPPSPPGTPTVCPINNPGCDLGTQGRICRDNCTFCGDDAALVGDPPAAKGLDAGEECDDGNSANFDGCNNSCLLETCSVLVDKAINCGEGPVDQTLVSANDDGTNSCSALVGEPVTVTYRVQNPSDPDNVTLVNCVLTDRDVNNGVIRVVNVGTVALGQTFTSSTFEEICSDARDDLEPDTATVVCDCGASDSGLGQRSAFDTATFVCEDCPTDTSTLSSETGQVVPGTSVTDTATVTTTCPDLIPTGTVEFYLCGPLGSPTGCAAGNFVSTETLVGGSATSNAVAPTELGFYCWRAVYTPDGPPFTGSSETNDPANECFEVVGTPDCDVQKSVTSPSKATDTVIYSLGPICNTGDVPLELVSCQDVKNNGDSSDCSALISHCFPLAVGACCDGPTTPFAYVDYTIQGDDPDPLTNVITVTCSGAGQTAQCSDDASVDLVHPRYTVNKSCTPETQTLDPGATGTIDWQIVLHNTGDTGLEICCDDPVAGISNECRTLAAGEQTTIPGVQYVVTEQDCDTSITNTVSCEATLTDVELDNVVPPDLANSNLTDTCSVACQRGCRMTGGHVNMAGDVDAGFGSISGTKYTTGGQIGAPNESGCCDYPPKGKCVNGLCTGGLRGGLGCTTNDNCPNSPRGSEAICPWGDWEHNHHSGPDDGYIVGGSFAFHSGTAAAPNEAFISNIICADPGWCVQARPAPNKQIFWEGTGVFHNLKGAKGTTLSLPDFPPGCSSVKVWDRKTGGSLHYYKAHVGDFGEPAGQRQKPVGPACTRDGLPVQDFCDEWDINCELVEPVCEIDAIENLDKTALHPLCTAQDCSACPDWYDIEIYCKATNPVDDPTNTIIYKVGHFILQGNFQLHPPVGDSCQPCGDGNCQTEFDEDCLSCPEDCGPCVY